MSQGALTDNHKVDDDFDDLDALLADRALEPRKVKLGGRTFSVRRDLTGEEVLRYWSLARQRKDIEALAIMVGDDDAVELNQIIDPLPMAKMQVVLGKIMRLAGLLPPEQADDDKEKESGESSAS